MGGIFEKLEINSDVHLKIKIKYCIHLYNHIFEIYMIRLIKCLLARQQVGIIKPSNVIYNFKLNKWKFIERFFMICGIIATQKNQNLNEGIFYDRTMLCAKMKLLEK